MVIINFYVAEKQNFKIVMRKKNKRSLEIKKISLNTIRCVDFPPPL